MCLCGFAGLSAILVLLGYSRSGKGKLGLADCNFFDTRRRYEAKLRTFIKYIVDLLSYEAVSRLRVLVAFDDRHNFPSLAGAEPAVLGRSKTR